MLHVSVVHGSPSLQSESTAHSGGGFAACAFDETPSKTNDVKRTAPTSFRTLTWPPARPSCKAMPSVRYQKYLGFSGRISVHSGNVRTVTKSCPALVKPFLAHKMAC